MRRSRTISIPSGFTFNQRGVIKIDSILKYMDPSISNEDIIVDISSCDKSNYQALSLLIQYAWKLSSQGCTVSFRYGYASSGATRMMRDLGASSMNAVVRTDGMDFTTAPSRRLFALRRRADTSNVITLARKSIQNYQVGFPDYLTYIVSELLYNATEHGRRSAEIEGSKILIPAIFNYWYYTTRHEITFLFSDLGIGIKEHLEQTYPKFKTDQEAILYALRPQVSGTFSRQESDPYAASNNAGMGLNYSSIMMRRLKGDMYIVSGNGQVHVSPQDITTAHLAHSWPGTFVLVTLNLASNQSFPLEQLMAEIEANARQELSETSETEVLSTFSISMEILFGVDLVDKEAAISYRDRYLLPAAIAGKRIDLDFANVKTAPHSFLNALLATAIKRMGMASYKKLRLVNAPGFVHEIVNTILEHNTPKI